MKAFIYMMICLTFCSELIHCSCLSYGHSCWGAHGKRSSSGIMKKEIQPERWTLFQTLSNDNIRNKIQQQQDDDLLQDIPMDYMDVNTFRKPSAPQIYLNSMEDNSISASREKPNSFPLFRKRRLYKNDRTANQLKSAAIF